MSMSDKHPTLSVDYQIAIIGHLLSLHPQLLRESFPCPCTYVSEVSRIDLDIM